MDVFDSAELHGQGLALSEMVNRGTSRATLVDSRVEGQTVCLGGTDDSFIFSTGVKCGLSFRLPSTPPWS